MIQTISELVVNVGDVAFEVELDFEAVGEGYFVSALHLLAVDNELLGITVDDIAGDIHRNEGDGQTVGALHLFPNTFAVELDNGAVGEQRLVLLTLDISIDDCAAGPVLLNGLDSGLRHILRVDGALFALGINCTNEDNDGEQG